MSDSEAYDRFVEADTVARAEQVVASARVRELLDTLAAARRRVSAAQGRLTTAKRDGSAHEIEAATAHLEQAQTAASGIAAAVANETGDIIEGRTAANAELFDLADQMRARTSDDDTED